MIFVFFDEPPALDPSDGVARRWVFTSVGAAAVILTSSACGRLAPVPASDTPDDSVASGPGVDGGVTPAAAPSDASDRAADAGISDAKPESSVADAGSDSSLALPDASPLDPSPACAAVPASAALDVAAVRAGTRLSPRTISEDVPAGVEVPYEIFDSQLGVACKPLSYGDGTIRCVPQVRLLPFERYADAAKTILVALEPLFSAPAVGTLTALYSGTSDGPYDGGKITVKGFGRIGAMRASSTYFESSGWMSNAPPGYGVYPVIPEPFDLVELHEVRTQLAGSIAVRELHGTDGSRLFATDLYDTLHDTVVYLRRNAPGGARMLPPHAYGASAHFGPPPSGAVTAAWCSAPDVIFGLLGGPGEPSPPTTPRFVTSDAFETFGVVSQTGLIYGCSDPGGLDAPPAPVVVTARKATVLTPCATVPLTDWTPVSKVTVGNGRLTRSVDAIDGVAFDPPRSTAFMSFFDAALSTDCLPATAADDVLRCVPWLSSAFVGYSDDACTVRVAAKPGAGGPPSYIIEGSKPSNGFPTAQGALTLYQVGAPVAPTPMYFQSDDGTCHLTGVMSAFDIGEPVPSSTFVPFVLHDAPTAF